MRVTLVRNIVAAAIPMAGVAFILTLAGDDFLSAQGSSCGMMLNDTPAVFCETFDQPFPVTNRSGQMDGTVWGVSRLSGGTGLWKTSLLDSCNGTYLAAPPNDVIVCNGQMRQASDDGGNVTILAAYPKQPFDFANRTGTVAFDVTNDTSGGHGTWPEFWISDLPVPAPFVHSIPCDFCSVPRHALGIRFAAAHGDCGATGWRAEAAVAIRNYVVEERAIFDTSTSGMQIRQTGCATLSSGPNGGLNHIEIRVSQNTIDIYSTDAGSRSPLRKINTITNANLSFTRGLIWIEDGHYNAVKADVTSYHTFTWDNIAFDGPATYRDISLDVLDHLAPSGLPGLLDLSWNTTPSSPANLTTVPVTANYIAAATRAILMFNFEAPQITTFNYSINGHAVSAPSPLPSTLIGSHRSVALDVPLSYLVPGSQNIVLSGNQAMGVQNINIVLVAAAPVPGGSPPGAPTNLRIVP